MRTFVKNLSRPKVTLTGYIQDTSAEMPNVTVRPAVLVFPGGGYEFCSDREAEPVALAYAAEGYNAFVLRYSVGPDRPGDVAFADANEAMAHIRSNASEYNIDKNKIAVAGFSAGGHLAAWLSVSGEIRPNAAILCYPVTLDDPVFGLGREMPDICGGVDAKTPETFIFSTADDRVVPVRHSLAYAAALDKAKIGFEAHVFANGEHGLSLAKPYTSSGRAGMASRGASQWFALSVNWLNRVFKCFNDWLS